MKIIGLIPAAGHATRLGSLLSGSKELVSINDSAIPPRVACEFLLLQMHAAGIERAQLVIRDGKQDIPAFLNDGRDVGVLLTYTVTSATAGVPHTLDRAYAQVRGAVVALGFPDILVDDSGCLARLVRAYRARPVDLLLGLFPLAAPDSMDAVEMNEHRVLRVITKPGRTALTHTWAFAIWRAAFTDFMHQWLMPASHIQREIFVGDVIQAAIDAGLDVAGTVVSDQPFFDVGTPQGLAAARRRFGKRAD